MKETKKDKLERCREILYKNDSIEGEEHNYIMNILKLHKDSVSKIGVGVKRFFRKVNFYGGKCFWIERLDGTTTDFSFIKSINHPSAKSEIKKACRNAVFEYQDSLRNKKNVDIHHHFISFKEIVAEWLEKKSHLNLKINDTKDGCLITKFTDNRTSRDFFDFHQKRATLIEVSKTEHKRIHTENLINEPLEKIKGVLVK